jgi:pSer/pThr/pTyr-binding forkhead associated (FHA) protein
MATHKDSRASWIDDAVTSLGFAATSERFELSPVANEYIVGSSPECELRLEDPSGFVSRRHARLSRSGIAWTIHDLESTNGVRLDGERRLSFQLTPGAELEIGNVRLIAESVRLLELRAFVERIIGWDEAARRAVDDAIHALRYVATRNTVLVLCGAGDLAPTVHRLHVLAFGDEAFGAFGVNDPITTLDGTVCVSCRAGETPLHLAEALRDRTTPSRVIVCVQGHDDIADVIARLRIASTTVEIPSLERRENELDELITAYTRDAMGELGAPTDGFREHELIWLRKVEIGSLEELEELGRRVVAVRNWGVKGGARKLGISHVALSRWLRRRKIPT